MMKVEPTYPEKLSARPGMIQWNWLTPAQKYSLLLYPQWPLRGMLQDSVLTMADELLQYLARNMQHVSKKIVEYNEIKNR